MKLLQIGERVINCDHLVSMSFADGVYLGFTEASYNFALADKSPEGQAVRWFFTSGQEPFLWVRPYDVVAMHAEAQASEVHPFPCSACGSVLKKGDGYWVTPAPHSKPLCLSCNRKHESAIKLQENKEFQADLKSILYLKPKAE